jgi:primosomal protein N' (replication factor Y)
MRFAEVILPLPLPGTFTYALPDDLIGQVRPGCSVEVPFGSSKLYTGIVAALREQEPEGFAVKSILGLVDEEPVLGEAQLRFWHWMALYYLHPLGEIMAAALPAAFRLSSETRLVFNPEFGDDFSRLGDRAYLVAEALTSQPELSFKDVQKILDRKTVQPVIRELIQAGVARIQEELRPVYKPKTRKVVRLGEDWADAEGRLPDSEAVRELFAQLEKRAPKQLDLLLAYLHASRQGEAVYRKQLLHRTGASVAVYEGLLKKGVLAEEEVTVSRLESGWSEGDLPILSPAQQEALDNLRSQLSTRETALLHGITSSGKTALYLHLMAETAAAGRQALFLVPEIALTTQLTARLRAVFGDRIGVYHSRFNPAERVETWQAVARGQLDLVIGARSAVFLPFRDLGLVIVDEEHDGSYKQVDPSPRYHARDTAVYLAHQFGGKAVLGSATPSVESYHNALSGKYGLVTLRERYGEQNLPEVQLVNLREEVRRDRLHGHLSETLVEHMQAALERGEQIILFQNRRGYAPTLRCGQCGWVPQCIRCDVSLTYHKHADQLRCHLCGYRRESYSACPACGSAQLGYQGFGTEKVEDELALRFAKARVARMDLDTVSGKRDHERLISSFEQRDVDILVGTQMVTKGLDFAGVSLVGILNADALLWFPDFRSTERAFQLMAQVSGRAGRAGKGEVLIQTWEPNRELLRQVIEHDYLRFYEAEIAQRRQWDYPPFRRLIRLTLRHRDAGKTANAAHYVARLLGEHLGRRVLGPAAPPVGRVRGLYLQEILLKLEKTQPVAHSAREGIQAARDALALHPNFKAVDMQVNVDPA